MRSSLRSLHYLYTVPLCLLDGGCARTGGGPGDSPRPRADCRVGASRVRGASGGPTVWDGRRNQQNAVCRRAGCPFLAPRALRTESTRCPVLPPIIPGREGRRVDYTATQHTHKHATRYTHKIMPPYTRVPGTFALLWVSSNSRVALGMSVNVLLFNINACIVSSLFVCIDCDIFSPKKT